MPIQQKKPKTRITKNLEIEAKDVSMAYKSVLPQRLDSRNRGKTEQKIMLKKMRSIKLRKLYSLKQSEKRGASSQQQDWQATDSSSDDSSSIRSSPDRMKATGFSDGKNERFHQGERESGSNSPGSSTHRSATKTPFSVNQKKTSKSNIHACPSCFRPFEGQPKSRLNNNQVESEASPNYSAGPKMQVQASPRNSDSSFFSSDKSRTSSQSSSATSSQKSLQNLTKSSSVRKLRSRTSFKSKTSLVKKSSTTSQDLSLNRATCSSTLKDSKFPKEDEQHRGTESEIILAKKVCPYSHCSLHGHRVHAPEPPPRRFLFKRRNSMKKQKDVKPKGLSTGGVASYTDKKNVFQPRNIVSNMEPTLEKNSYNSGNFTVKNDHLLDFTENIDKPRKESYKGAIQENEVKDVAGILLAEKSVPAETTNENLSQNRLFTELEGISDCSIEAKRDESVMEIDNVLKVDAVFATNPGNGISIATFTGSIKDDLSTLAQVSSADDSGEATVQTIEKSLSNCHSLEELGDSKDKKNSHPDPKDSLGDVSSLDRECESKGRITLEDEINSVDLKGEAALALNPSNGISTATFTGKIPYFTNFNSPQPQKPNTKSGSSKNEPSSIVNVSFSDDYGEVARESSDISLPTCHPPEELDVSEEKNDHPNSNDTLVSDSFLGRESETTRFTTFGEDEATSSIHQARKSLVKKNNHISMWHMIHQQMVLGLTEEAENQPFHPTGEKERDVNTLPEANSNDFGPDISGPVSKELELRKLFAVKLVREAIEKILLPEVEDQSSDMLSVTSEAISDEVLSNKNQEKGEEQSNPGSKDAENNLRDDENEPVDDKSVYVEKENHAQNTSSAPEEENARIKSNQQPLKRWSNLRKIILLKRFVKELEKVKKFNPARPQLLPLEPEIEAEKVSLRPQTIGGKKSADEWMLDYALRQVVSQLAPTQKRKVALLVQAFETVVPPQDAISEARITDQKIENFSASNPVSFGKSDATDLSTPTTKDSQSLGNASLNADDSMSYVHEKFTLHSEEQGTQGMTDKYMELNNSCDVAAETPPAVRSSVTEDNEVANAANIVKSASDSNPPVEVIIAGEEESNKEDKPEHVVDREIPLLVVSKPDSMADGELKTQLGKQNIRMWHMIYQHVVSGIAEKVGTQLLDGPDEEEVDDANMLPGRKSSGSSDENMNTDRDDVGKENQDTNHQKMEFSKSIAVELVQEAVDEILLPEIQDDSSDSQSVAIDNIFLGHENHDGELSSLNSADFAEYSLEESDKSKVEYVVSLYGEKEASNMSSKEEGRAGSMVKNRLGMQKSKNWSKLKKLILLKRSIKALETFRKLKPQPSQQLPSTPDLEPEKIDLRRQMMDERRKAEQWMLDYTVQHIVTTLTPARKRRVAMLVEAFEAVVPFPLV